MLPNWFNKWVKENPTDIFGPAILIGAIGGAVIFAALIITWGQPYATASTQTGPRGTGMSIAKFPGADVDPTIEAFFTTAAIPPAAGAPLAKDVYENAEPLLGDLTAENYDRLVGAMREWTGIEDLFAGEENYQTIVARKMIQMTQHLNSEWDGHVAVNGAGVNCFTCHRGEAVPSNVWFRVDPVNEVMEGWSANQNRVSPVSGSTSLPSDALHKLLSEDGQITVHDLEPRVDNEGTATIQDTERTYALMNYFANSLNVNCNFCHNSRAFYDVAEVTPQWATASLGIEMVRDLNEAYLTTLQDVYPANRLGPVHGDAPKAACATCHKGYSRPMGGAAMIEDWPELAAPGAPEYE
ncbi:MAG: photosynthetic reaction center cytochrome PufC [Pseudomonadota bacterium]